MEKNFWEMHDSLPLDQRQHLIDHMVLTLLGKPTKPLILTMGLTIANDAPLEERIQLIAKAYNIDPKDINIEDFLRNEKEINDSKYQVKEIIKDHYAKLNGKGERKKDDELISAGKFLYTTQITGQLSPDEEPDFIIDQSEKSIGLEHTRLQAGPDKAYVSDLWKRYLKDPLAKILKDRPRLKGVVNITLNADVKVIGQKTLRDFKAKEIKNYTKKVHEMLENSILAEISGEVKNLPPFIKNISYQSSSETFTLRNNQEYFVRGDFDILLAQAIKKKEKRLIAYKKKKQFKEWWLLIVYSEEGASSSFKINNSSLKVRLKSNFDRVFILNSFNLQCFELSDTEPFLTTVSKKQFSQPWIGKNFHQYDKNNQR